MALAKAFSEERQWDFQLVREPESIVSRSRNEQDLADVAVATGILIQPHENAESLRLEFNQNLQVDNWIKTQFAPIDIHVQVCELFHFIHPLFKRLKVDDEGEYFQTGDVAILTKHIDEVAEVIREYLLNPKNRGPFRMADGRIVDLAVNE